MPSSGATKCKEDSFIKFSETSHEIHSSRFAWKIKNYKIEKEYAITTSFSSGLAVIEDDWTMEFYIYSPLTICLRRAREIINRNHKFTIHWKLSILNHRKSNIISKSNTYNIRRCTSDVAIWKPSLTFAEIFDGSNGFLFNNALIIICDIKILLDPSVLALMNEILVAKKTIEKDLAQVLDCEKYGDLTFKVGDKLLTAYKGILAVRSPFFAAMFAHDGMKENQTNEVTISDFDADVFKELLHFIYTDEAPNIENMAFELLAAAEKYQLERLKNLSEITICKQLSVENAMSTFNAACIFDLSGLKKECAEFIKFHVRGVSQSRGYLEIKDTNTAIIAELFTEIGQIS